MGNNRFSKGYAKLELSKPKECDRCGGELKYIGTGQYECVECKDIMLDDYGKVKEYMDESGTASPIAITRNTGVSNDVVEYLVDEGFINVYTGKVCGSCGPPIDSGRFCKPCTYNMLGGITDAFKEEKAQDAQAVKAQQDAKKKELLSSAGKMHISRRG